MLCLLFTALHFSSHIYCERDWVYSMAHFSVDPCCTRTIPAQLQAVRAHLMPTHSKAFEAFSELVQGTSDCSGHKQRETPVKLGKFFSSTDVFNMVIVRMVQC